MTRSGAEESPRFLIRVLRTQSGILLPEPVRELTPAEYDEYLPAAKYLREYESFAGLPGFAVHNEREYFQTVSAAAMEYRRHGFDMTTLNRFRFHADRRIANYLTTARLIIDQTDRRLANRYGKASEEYRRYEEACSSVYDSVFSYRFLYRLRNYVQHRGLPVGKLSVVYTAETSESPEDLSLKLFFDTERLLADYDGWRSVAEELRRMNSHFAIDDHLPSMTKALKDLHGVAIQLEYEDLLSAGRRVLDGLADALGTEGVPALGDATYDERKDVTTYSIDWPPIRMLEHLKLLGHK